METKRLESFKAGESVFASNGVSKVKVTKDNEPICYEIPIKSTGITELIDTFKTEAPMPPVIDYKATPESAIGKDLKVSKNQWIKMYDYTDVDYLKQMEDHNSDMGTAIVMKGIAIPILDEKGEEITDDQKKIETLKAMKMTGEHFSQIVEDITSLTKWSEEEKEDFLSGNSDSEK